MRYPLVVFFLVFAALLFLKNTPMYTAQKFIPIGDSYTIGEGVGESERWPNLLANHLTETGVATKLVANPGRTGWTSQQAIANELPLIEREQPNLVTILIGVNDIVQGVPAETFQKNLNEIIDRTVAAIGPSGKIVLVSIPDFTLTPTGKSFGDPLRIKSELSSFNEIIKNEATKRRLPLADIHEVSTRLGEDPVYTANDGLHPSGAAYIEWEKEIYTAFKQ